LPKRGNRRTKKILMSKHLPTCPACGGKESVPIVYGFPTVEVQAAEARNEVRLAACIVSATSPDRSCTACEYRFYSNRKLQPEIDPDEIHQRRRIAAMNRGQYMTFNVKTQSAEEIADALRMAHDKRRKKS
jgi:hypothetical protein